jgi:hypothetical protein
MNSPRFLGALAAGRLRYFRYSPPAGGFGGDWDVLAATSQVMDLATLARVLSLMGHEGPPPSTKSTTVLGFLEPGGIKTSVAVTRVPAAPDAWQVELTAGVYVTPERIEDARRLETWLDLQQVPMSPR